MALDVSDRAVLIYGTQGVCQDTPLTYMWAQVKTVRTADGPDEAHLEQLGRRENKKGGDVSKILRRQVEITDGLMRRWKTEDTSITQLTKGGEAVSA
jgi:acyl-CoA dehydrogenase